jgi:hypothetical protein
MDPAGRGGNPARVADANPLYNPARPKPADFSTPLTGSYPIGVPARSISNVVHQTVDGQTYLETSTPTAHGVGLTALASTPHLSTQPAPAPAIGVTVSTPQASVTMFPAVPVAAPSRAMPNPRDGNPARAAIPASPSLSGNRGNAHGGVIQVQKRAPGT